uniref:Uncharacterized protein n=1 Tax=Zea mays TaxID=4577 RepID=B8A1H7_MAIZE|nr:unknown [Zea mays]
MHASYSHTVLTLSKRTFWLFRGVGSSDMITCGIVIPPETIISMPSRIDKLGLIISAEFTKKMSPIYK